MKNIYIRLRYVPHCSAHLAMKLVWTLNRRLLALLKLSIKPIKMLLMP